MKIQFLHPVESLCSENVNMTNLSHIIENSDDRLSCNLFSNNGPERPLEAALTMLVQGRSRPFLLLAHEFTFGKRNGSR